MSKATAKNEIQMVLQEYLGNRKAAKVAETASTVEFETITIEGSNSQIYFDMLKYTPASETEKKFLEFLKEAVDAGVKTFKVPVCDPSIDENGSLQFVAGYKPAVGYSYNELEELAINNGVQLGSKNQYILFLATIILRLVEEGWPRADAFYAVCTNSTRLGNYRNSEKAGNDFEVTGSRKIAGKCDLANTVKILVKDKGANDFWVASGSYNDNGGDCPLASFELLHSCDYHHYDVVGWFVL